MPATFVSVIHGTRRLYHLHPNRRWMDVLGKYLLDRGVAGVSCFEWSGGLLRGFRAVDAPAYAKELLELHSAARAAGGSLSIVAKSLGGVIAERALLLLRHQIQVDLFLRIAVPDTRVVLDLPNVSRVVNVISSEDRLYRLGLWAAPLFPAHRQTSQPTATETITILRLSHFDLTECTPLRDGQTTYELYSRLLIGVR